VKGAINSLILTRSYRQGVINERGPFSVTSEHHDPFITEIHVQTICPIFYMLHHEITSFNTIPPLMSSFCMVISIIYFFTMNYRRVGPSPLVRRESSRISTTGVMWNPKCIWMRLSGSGEVSVGVAYLTPREVHVNGSLQSFFNKTTWWPSGTWHHVSVVQLGGSRQLLWFVCVNEDQ
jgi:hypothetical protein